MDTAGRVFVVTGAASGIGRCVAQELVRRGGYVVGADRNDAGLAETSLLIGDRSRFSTHVLDIGDADAIAVFPDEVIVAHGRVDGLFNIAGIPQPVSTVTEVDADTAEQILRINFFGTLWMCRAFLPRLEERPDGAVIMNTSSLSAIAPFPGAAIYGASKAAVALMSYGLAQDLRGRSKVTVTAALPGTVWTGLVRDTARSLGTSEALAQRFAMRPERAARRMVDATLKGRQRVVIGADAHLFDAANRLSTHLAERMSYLQVGSFVYRRPRG